MKIKLLKKVRKRYTMFYYPEKWVSGFGDDMDAGYYLFDSHDNIFFDYAITREGIYNKMLFWVLIKFKEYGVRRMKINSGIINKRKQVA